MEMNAESLDSNVLDAASRGAAEGLTLALNVGAMLLAFLALIAMIDYLLSLPSLLWNEGALGDLIAYYQANHLVVPDGCSLATVADDAIIGCIDTMSAAAGAPDVMVAPMITLKTIFGYVFWPFAWIMGVPTQDCFLIGQLLGEKMVVNELVAYGSLAAMLNDPTIHLSGRSVVIVTYALCGFANFGSIGIQLGGIGGIAPNRKGDLAQIALRAMLGGTLAAFMTGTIAGILI
jgi:CNT family concentrative nucleoside transporter